MSTLAVQTAEMLSHLPEEELSLINALVKKLIVAWDPDFTKLTSSEKEGLDQSDQEMKDGEYYSEEEVFG